MTQKNGSLTGFITENEEQKGKFSLAVLVVY